MKKILMVLVLLVGTALFAAPATQAVDTTSEDSKVCTKRVVDKAAFDEVVPGTPSQWWNWSPNNNQEPFEGPPDFPTDDRGTWQGPHTEGGPGQDQTGTFQAGEGNSDWFHREAATEDRTIHHDATFKTIEVPCKDKEVKSNEVEKEVESTTVDALPQSGA